jgi:hypothetical protein
LGSGASLILVQEVPPHLRQGGGSRPSNAPGRVGPPTANTVQPDLCPQVSHRNSPAFWSAIRSPRYDGGSDRSTTTLFFRLPRYAGREAFSPPHSGNDWVGGMVSRTTSGRDFVARKGNESAERFPQNFSEGRWLLELARLLDSSLEIEPDGTPVLLAIYDHPHLDRSVGLRHRLNDFPMSIPEGRLRLKP